MPVHRYRIVVADRLGEIFCEAFDGMAIESVEEGTALIGDLDQGSLYATLSRVHALGLELIEAVRVPPAGEDG